MTLQLITKSTATNQEAIHATGQLYLAAMGIIKAMEHFVRRCCALAAVFRILHCSPIGFRIVQREV